MDAKHVRVGVLLSPTVPLWTGTVVSYVAGESFLLEVTPKAGLSSSLVGWFIDLAGRFIRIRAVDTTGTNAVLTIAPNGLSFAVGATVSVYNVIYPAPKYQRIKNNVVTVTGGVAGQLVDWRFTGTGGYTTLYWSIGAPHSKLRLYSDASMGDDSIVAVGNAFNLLGNHGFTEKNNSGVNGTVTLTNTTPGSGSLTIVPFIIYKDFDRTWQSLGASDDARNKVAQGPVAIVNPEAAAPDLGEHVIFSAVGSFATYDGSSVDKLTRYPATINATDYVWAVGAGGTIHSGQNSPIAEVSFSTAGFRYVSLTVTDTNGSAITRQIPVWAGVTPYPVDGVTVPWRIDEDSSVELIFKSPPAFLRHTLVCLVDLDTRECLYLGYAWPASVEYDYEKSTLSLTAYQTLSFLKNVYYYPFIVTGIWGGAIGWEYFDVYTAPRGVYFLLRWHSNFLEIANARFDVRVTAGPPASPPGALAAEIRHRYIQGFSAGTLYDEIKIMAKESFYSIYNLPLGGFEVIPSLLMGSAITGTITETGVNSDTLTLALSSGDMVVPVRKDLSVPTVSEATLWGFYHNVAFNVFPIKIKAPIQPEDYGRPTEVPNLLASPILTDPTDPGWYEILRWGGRLVGLSNYANTYIIRPSSDVALGTYKMVDIPDPANPLATVRVVVEQKTVAFREGGFAEVELIGRDFGITTSSVVAPVDPTPITPPTIGPNPIPNLLAADFVGVPTSGGAPLTVAFTDQTTGGTPTAWAWSFGDGGSSSSQNPTHVYTSPGLYTVSLTATDANGASDTEMKVGYILVILCGVDSLTTMCSPPVTVVNVGFAYEGCAGFSSPGVHLSAFLTYISGTFQISNPEFVAGRTIRVTMLNTGATDIEVALSQPFYEFGAVCSVIATNATNWYSFTNGSTLVLPGLAGQVGGGPTVQFCLRLRKDSLNNDLPACSGVITLIEVFDGVNWITVFTN